jgi:hypothetical protein
VSGTAVPGRIRVVAVLASTLAAFAFPATIEPARAQEGGESHPAHASAAGSEEPVSASARVESPRGSRAGHRTKDKQAPHGAEPGHRGNGRSSTTGSDDGGTRTEDGKEPKQDDPKKDEEPKQGSGPKKDKEAKDEKTTGPPPGQRGSGASDRARERANPSSPVGAPPPAEPTPAPAPSIGSPPPARVPTVPLPEADRAPRRTPTTDAPLAAAAPPTTPVAVPVASSGQGAAVALLAPAPVEAPSSPTAVDPPTELLGDVELPVGNGAANHFGALGRSVLDAILDRGARSFQVPFLLLLALGGYLVLQRGFGRGNLPMIATDLPVTVAPGPEAGADDARYVL